MGHCGSQLVEKLVFVFYAFELKKFGNIANDDHLAFSAIKNKFVVLYQQKLFLSQIRLI